MIRTWLRQHPGEPADPLFPTITGRPLSSNAVQDLVERHIATAAAGCPSIQDKNVTPHTLRHSAAMALLHAGVDPVTIALWMGHESPRSTQPYIHADLKLKEKALARTSPPTTKQAGTARPTSSSRSSRAWDYAARLTCVNAVARASLATAGIIAVPA